jgi:hypothetical protein
MKELIEAARLVGGGAHMTEDLQFSTRHDRVHYMCMCECTE